MTAAKSKIKRSKQMADFSNESKKKDETKPKELASKLGPEKLGSPSQEETDEATKELFTKEEKDEQGNVTYISSLSEAEWENAKRIAAGTPKFENLTQAMFGHPGQTNLTANGTLNSDGTERQFKTLEEFVEAAEKTASGNPTPNRVGNEMTNIELRFSPMRQLGIDKTISATLDRLHVLRTKKGLSEEDKKELQEIEESLQVTKAS